MPGKGRLGRPVLLEDPKRRAKVLEALEAGSPDGRAAQAGGVHPDTLRVYLIACAEDGVDEEKAGFPATVEEARAKGFQEKLKRLKSIGDQDENLNAAMKSLELQLRMSGDVQGPGGPSIEAGFDEDGRLKSLRASAGGDVEELSDDELGQKLERAEADLER